MTLSEALHRLRQSQQRTQTIYCLGLLMNFHIRAIREQRDEAAKITEIRIREIVAKVVGGAPV